MVPSPAPVGDIPSWMDAAAQPFIPLFTRRNGAGDNLGVVHSYDQLYRLSDGAGAGEILCYLHDDVICREEEWDVRIAKEFEDQTVGVVGFGGARRHGAPSLYTAPYRLQNLARYDYLSNVDDAEVHGTRFTGSADVAVVDGFSLCIRRRLLDRMDGFKVLIEGGIDFLCYDYAICAMAHRYGYRVRMAGIRCHHRGGGTSTKVNPNRQAEYDRSHRWYFDEFRNEMPWVCK